jgi:two-component system, OmpR family, sensor kinase
MVRSVSPRRAWHASPVGRTWWRTAADALVQRSFRGDPAPDPDRVAYRRSVLAIGVRVAIVSAALVLSILLLVAAYIAWQLTPGQLAEPRDPTDVTISLDTVDVTVGLLGLGGLTIVFAGLAAWVIARRSVRPLADALHLQRTFVADASHELRTPLTVLDARVQRLRMLVPRDDPSSRVVDELRDDTRVLVDIVDDLLEAAAGDPRDGSVASVAAELAAAAGDLAVLAASRDVRLVVGSADVLVPMSGTAFRRCVVALVDNAIGHTPPGGTVAVEPAAVGARVAIRVRDEGSGITGIEPRRVFERFAHGTPADPARVGTRTGYGIGLALVRDLAVRAGGDVRVESTGASGTVFLLELPVVGDGA